MLRVSGANAEGFLGGTVKNFAVGSSEPSEYSATEIAPPDTSDTAFTVSEADRLFLRMSAIGERTEGSHEGDSVGLAESAPIDVAQHLMTSGAVFFAPFGGAYRKSTGMGRVSVTFADGSEKTYSESATVRVVGDEDKAASALSSGDVLDENGSPVVASVETLPQNRICWTRTQRGWNFAHDEERISTEDSESESALGLSFKVYQAEGDSKRGYVFFDDARFEVSNVLWDYSPDSGNTWYQMFTLPNVPYMRLSLPYKTNQLRVRATSRSDEEWIRGYSIHPIPSWKKYPKPSSEPQVSLKTPLRWEMSHPVQSPIFILETDSGEKVVTRRFNAGQGVVEGVSSVSVDYLDGDSL